MASAMPPSPSTALDAGLPLGDDPVAIIDASGRILDASAAWHDSVVGLMRAASAEVGAFDRDIRAALQVVLGPGGLTQELTLEIGAVSPDEGARIRISRCSDLKGVAILRLERCAKQISPGETLATLIDKSPYLVIEADCTGRITYVNDRFIELTGWSEFRPGESSVNLFQLGIMESAERQRLLDAVKRGRAHQYQQAIQTKDGARLHLKLGIRPLRQDARNVEGWIAVGHDVSEHIKLRDRYVSHATRLQLSLESARMGSWEVNNKTGVAVVDDSWLQLAGVSSADRDRAGDIWKSQIHPDDRNEMLQRIDGAIDGSADVQSSQYRVIRPDGSMIWVQDTSRVTERDAAGAPVKLIGVVADITPLKDALTSAERSAERLWIATEAAGLGVWDYDLIEKKYFWSRRMREIHGLREEDESIKSYTDLTHPDDRAELEAAVMAGRTTGEAIEMRYRIVRPDGTLRNLEAYAIFRLDKEGRAVRAVGATRDVTAQVSLELERRQAQKLESVGRLAAGIAHEINTPMQYVGENLRFVKDAYGQILPLIDAATGAGDGQADLVEVCAQLASNKRAIYLLREAPQAIDEALDGIDRVAEIMRSMRAFSHPGNTRTPTDINEAISNALTISRSAWSVVATVQQDFDPELPLVSITAGEFNQALLNLILNAAHAIGERQLLEPAMAGLITIRTRRNGDLVEVSLADNGCGMTSDVQDKIFDPFFTTKPIGQGTGQGLALAHGFVGRHNGTISVKSNPGSGTTFTIRLPI